MHREVDLGAQFEPGYREGTAGEVDWEQKSCEVSKILDFFFTPEDFFPDIRKNFLEQKNNARVRQKAATAADGARRCAPFAQRLQQRQERRVAHLLR